MDTQEIVVQFLAKARDFSVLQSDQTRPLAQPASWSMSTVGSFTREGSSWGMKLYLHSTYTSMTRTMTTVPTMQLGTENATALITWVYNYGSHHGVTQHWYIFKKNEWHCVLTGKLIWSQPHLISYNKYQQWSIYNPKSKV